MCEDPNRDLAIDEGSLVAEIAKRISWTAQGWPVVEDREDNLALQKCYSWLAWQDLPLAMVPENDIEFDEFVSSNIFLKIGFDVGFDGKNLNELVFVTREQAETYGRRSDVAFVPAAFGAKKLLLRLKAFKFLSEGLR